MKLTKKQHECLKRYVFDGRMTSMFGDGMEGDYIMDGFPTIKGIRFMSDDELIKEAADYSSEDDVKEFLEEVKK